MAKWPPPPKPRESLEVIKKYEFLKLHGKYCKYEEGKSVFKPNFRENKENATIKKNNYYYLQ